MLVIFVADRLVTIVIIIIILIMNYDCARMHHCQDEFILVWPNLLSIYVGAVGDELWNANGRSLYHVLVFGFCVCNFQLCYR